MSPFLVAAAALILSLNDPPGDAFGNGSLLPPSAPVYRDATAFDLRELNVVGEDAIALEIEMGSLSNPAGLPLGFTQPVIEVYLDSTEGGATELLPGSGMRMPDDAGWEYAVRITGDSAVGYAYRSDGAPVELPVGVRTEGSTILATTPFAAADEVAVYALVGLYDPLGEAVWRPLTRERSTWSFSSVDQRVPVVDLLAPTVEAQAAAIDSGVLPRPGRSRDASTYLLLMAFGLVVALVGLLLRRRVHRDTGSDGDAAAEAAAAEAPDDAALPEVDAGSAHGATPDPAGPAAASTAAAGPTATPPPPGRGKRAAREADGGAAASRKPFGWNGAATPATDAAPDDAPAVAGAEAGSAQRDTPLPGAWLKDEDPFGDEFTAIFGRGGGREEEREDVFLDRDPPDPSEAASEVGDADPERPRTTDPRELPAVDAAEADAAAPTASEDGTDLEAPRSES